MIELTRRPVRVLSATFVIILSLAATFSTACATFLDVDPSKPEELNGFLIMRAVFQNYNSDHLAGFDAEAIREINRYAGPPTAGFLRQAATRPASQASRLSVGVVGNLALMHANGGMATQVLGGVRVSQFKAERPLNFFGEATAGLTHFSGENDFTLKPTAGVYVPLRGKRFQIVGSVGLPIIFFPGVHERGLEVSGGIAFPFR